MADSRLPKFHKLSVDDRLALLRDHGALTQADYEALLGGKHVLTPEQADRLTENVIGTFSLPVGLGLNFQLNDRDYLVPMVVEEPSIIAAVSSAAKVVRRAGGFTTSSDEPLLIGQLQILDLDEPLKAIAALEARKDEVVALANSGHPNMVRRGGGARDLEVFLHARTAKNGELVVAHLVVDTRDAMGANLVNSMCEAVAPLVEQITGGRVFLRILSNLTDRALVRARAVVPAALLETSEFSGERVRDGIVLAGEFAELDPYRATTHNKGIMNGIDAVALATGNDWRAIEAAAHAFAARDGRYSPLTRWSVDEKGALVGELEMPLKVGTVGGQVESNPAVKLAHTLLGVRSATELAEVMAAVGLAQNMAALRALSTEGIQPGHMRLHARAVAVAAGADRGIFDEVVSRLVASGDIKVWKARRIIDQVNQGLPPTGAISVIDRAAIDAARAANARSAPIPAGATDADQVGYGKIIVLGEHAVVYGGHAIAAPINLSIRARAEKRPSGLNVSIPDWDMRVAPDQPVGVDTLQQVAALITGRLGVADEGIHVDVFAHLPRASGLGASAALAVAVIRAVAGCFNISLSDRAVSELAYECEQIVHGTPSGIDNTVATFGRPILYRKADATAQSEIRGIYTPQPIPIVIGLTGVKSLTAHTVGRVREAWKRNPTRYEQIFAQINDLALAGADAMESGNLVELGELMNINQGMLNALQVSSPELEELVDIARRAGALGAKLTGGGGGGAMIALAGPDGSEPITNAMRRAGYRSFLTEIR